LHGILTFRRGHEFSGDLDNQYVGVLPPNDAEKHLFVSWVLQGLCLRVLSLTFEHSLCAAHEGG
jgi:hypothetical protein